MVGYGTGAEGDYFEIKNSWGAEWGAGGFMRLKRGVSDRHGQNGLATMPAYVVKTRPNEGGPSVLVGPDLERGLCTVHMQAWRQPLEFAAAVGPPLGR